MTTGSGKVGCMLSMSILGLNNLGFICMVVCGLLIKGAYVKWSMCTSQPSGMKIAPDLTNSLACFSLLSQNKLDSLTCPGGRK